MTAPEDSWVVWDDEPGQNIDHIAEHGLTPAEVESVLRNSALPIASSESSSRPCRFGWTHTGRFIVVVWDQYEETEPPYLLPRDRLRSTGAVT